jgi:hypothetical protein
MRGCELVVDIAADSAILCACHFFGGSSLDHQRSRRHRLENSLLIGDARLFRTLLSQDPVDGHGITSAVFGRATYQSSTPLLLFRLESLPETWWLKALPRVDLGEAPEIVAYGLTWRQRNIVIVGHSNIKSLATRPELKFCFPELSYYICSGDTKLKYGSILVNKTVVFCF